MDQALDPSICAISAAHGKEELGRVPSCSEMVAQRLERCTLTVREASILLMVADGKSNKLIASQLRLSPQTVKSHLRNIFAKLGASDRAHAVCIAVRGRLIAL